MIMRPGQQLLLPASPLFIWSSLLAALALNFIQNIGLWGRAAWEPDWVAIVLVFWSIHQPQRIGVGVAFLFGLAMDVHQGSVLGQHALAYAVMGYFAISVHRRVLWFPLSQQALQVLPILATGHVLALVVRLVVGDAFAGWSLFLAPVIEAVLWPVATLLLLAPQRRAPDPDENRPL